MKNGCPSDLKLSLTLVPGELTAEDRAGIVAHLADCDGCRGRLDTLRAEREALYARRPALDLPEPRPRAMWRLALAGAVSCLLLAVGLWFGLVHDGNSPAVRFKGNTPSLSFRVEREGRVIAGRSHMQLFPDDRIRFAYSVDEDAYLAIVNVDSRGRITAYFPGASGQSNAIRAGTEVFLPGSIRLDDYLGKERIFAVFSRKPLTVESVEEVVREAFARVNDVEKIETLAIRGVQATILITKVKGHE